MQRLATVEELPAIYAGLPTSTIVEENTRSHSDVEFFTRIRDVVRHEYAQTCLSVGMAELSRRGE
jgi:hypothetical protein